MKVSVSQATAQQINSSSVPSPHPPSCFQSDFLPKKMLQSLKSLALTTMAATTLLPTLCIASAIAQTAPGRTPAPPSTPTVPASPTSPIPAESAVPVVPPAPGLPGLRIPDGVVPPGQTQRGSYEENLYTLGPGDQIGIDIFDVPEFSGNNGVYVILIDGTVTFPWIGRVMLQGLTVEEARQELTRRYDRFIRDTPIITVNLLSARSLQVAVVGEVKRPGSYPISPEGGSNRILVGDATVAGGVANQWPTVTRLIQEAGGITQMADLRKVEVRRQTRRGTEVIPVNLFELIKGGDLAQDIRLRDGDTLVVPVAAALSSEDAFLQGSASIAPATIRVNVIGEAVTPGTIEVPPNTSMNAAIAAAGGFVPERSRRREVQLIRINPNGTAVRRDVQVDLAAGVNEETNPSLRDGDTVVIGRSRTIRVGDALETVFRPLTGVFGVFDLIRRIFDGDNN